MGSDRCVHHDPRPDELCAYLLEDGAQCNVPESIHPCRAHRHTRLRDLEAACEALVLATSCGQCAAVPSAPCITRAGRQLAKVHAKRKDSALASDDGERLLEEIKFYGPQYTTIWE
ncbi:hypothetical protein GCM10010278_76210 [Streptomyces melanogenes]|nr:hypothetical protein GCM10010278_76210 [Streptomyces melanogenes]